MLEAITKLRFPFKDKMCTRFATEVILKRCPGPESFQIAIRRPQTDELEEIEDVADYDDLDVNDPEFVKKFEGLINFVR